MPIEVTVTPGKVMAHGGRVSWRVRTISSLLGRLRTEILQNQSLGRMQSWPPAFPAGAGNDTRAVCQSSNTKLLPTYLPERAMVLLHGLSEWGQLNRITLGKYFDEIGNDII